MVHRSLGILALVVLTGCARDDSPALDGPVPTAEKTTTTAPASSTTTVATTAPPTGCPEIPPGSGNPEPVERSADVDGDGRVDTATSYRTEGEGQAAYVLQVALAAGGGASVQMPAAEGEASIALLGGTAIDSRDPREVLWVRVGSGAATTIVGAYHLDGCTLVAVTFASGDPVELPIGGTVGTVSGAACGKLTDPEADLLVYEASHLADDRYEVVTTEYRWDAGTLTPSPAAAPTVGETDNPADLAHFTCGPGAPLV